MGSTRVIPSGGWLATHSPGTFDSKGSPLQRAPDKAASFEVISAPGV